MNLNDKEFFSQSVHKYIVYKDIDETLKKYRKRVLSELHLRNLTEDFFKDRVLIDVGTGFQAIVASQMGAKFIYHLDQSKSQVLWMQEYCRLNGIHNIKSIQCDITKNIPIEDNSIDIVLFFGVWNHLITPSDFIRQLIPKLHVKESYVWLRVYRFGSWSRWLVENLRQISKKTDLHVIENLLNIRYPHLSSDQYKGDALDDLFAPVWGAFHPRQFYIECVATFINYKDFEYNFNDNDENFRVDFNLNNENIELFKKFNFPDKGECQTDFKFNKDYEIANEIQNIFNNWDEVIGSDNLEDKLITLYELVRKKPIFNFYTQVYIEDNSCADFTKRLELLLHILNTFKKEQKCI